jgi:NAD(P)H-quinone oxidoreductase subunit 6
MLVNKQEDFAPIANRWIRNASTGLVCVGLFALLSTMVLATPWSIFTGSGVVGNDSVVEIGKHLFSDFLLPFELASVLLLMAMVGAIILARRDYIPDELMPRDAQAIAASTLPERPRELVSASSVTPRAR